MGLIITAHFDCQNVFSVNFYGREKLVWGNGSNRIDNCAGESVAEFFKGTAMFGKFFAQPNHTPLVANPKEDVATIGIGESNIFVHLTVSPLSSLLNSIVFPSPDSIKRIISSPGS